MASLHLTQHPWERNSRLCGVLDAVRVEFFTEDLPTVWSSERIAYYELKATAKVAIVIGIVLFYSGDVLLFIENHLRSHVLVCAIIVRALDGCVHSVLRIDFAD